MPEMADSAGHAGANNPHGINPYAVLQGGMILVGAQAVVEVIRGYVLASAHDEKGAFVLKVKLAIITVIAIMIIIYGLHMSGCRVTCPGGSVSDADTPLVLLDPAPDTAGMSSRPPERMREQMFGAVSGNKIAYWH